MQLRIGEQVHASTETDILCGRWKSIGIWIPASTLDNSCKSSFLFMLLKALGHLVLLCLGLL
jgi:hypothetical protein